MKLKKKGQIRIFATLQASDFSKSQLTSEPFTSYDLLYLTYDPNYLDSILEFFATDKLFSQRRSERLPLVLDVSPRCQAKVLAPSEKKELSYGQKMTLVNSKSSQSGDLILEADNWSELFVKDAHVYIGHGLSVLKVIQVRGEKVFTEVLHSGYVKAGLEIQVPQTKKTPSILDLNYIDLKPLKNIHLDALVLPGLTDPRQILLAKRRLKTVVGYVPWLFICIDHLKVYENLDKLLKVADGVVIARKDLALSIETASLPLVTKEIIKVCHDYARPVYLLGDLFASMWQNPLATRAEVSDFGRAVYDGADGVVFSPEISSGLYKQEALNLGRKIAWEVEQEVFLKASTQDLFTAPIRNEFDAIAAYAYKTAQRVQAKAILCISREGNTALKLSSFHLEIPLLALTFKEETVQKLKMIRGVYPLYLPEEPSSEDIFQTSFSLLQEKTWLKKGDKIVLVTVTTSSVGFTASNLFMVHEL